jgi:hypothetical protein
MELRPDYLDRVVKSYFTAISADNDDMPKRTDAKSDPVAAKARQAQAS